MYSRLKEYVDELNRRNGYIIKTSQLAEAVKIRRATLIEWLNPDRELSRVEAGTMQQLAMYFGLEDNPGALIRYAWIDEDANESPETKTHLDERLREIA